jgi:hypothetical protein
MVDGRKTARHGQRQKDGPGWSTAERRHRRGARTGSEVERSAQYRTRLVRLARVDGN